MESEFDDFDSWVVKWVTCHKATFEILVLAKYERRLESSL